jgi:hypothetical protein
LGSSSYDFSSLDLEALIWTYWQLWGKWILGILVCGLAYMSMDRYSNMAFAIGGGCLGIGLAWSFISSVDLVFLSLGLALILIGSFLRMSGK